MLQTAKFSFSTHYRGIINSTQPPDFDTSSEMYFYERDIRTKARVTLNYTFPHYGEYFIVLLSYGVLLVNRKAPGELSRSNLN